MHAAANRSKLVLSGLRRASRYRHVGDVQHELRLRLRALVGASHVRAHHARPHSIDGVPFRTSRSVDLHLQRYASTGKPGNDTPVSEQQSDPDSTKIRTSSNPLGVQLRELRKITNENQGTLFVDPSMIVPELAIPFPRREMVSLTGKTVLVVEEARKFSATVVFLAFRSFADEQLASWRAPLTAEFSNRPDLRIYDVAVNESFASQALSGFVRRVQRTTVDLSLHDCYLTLNEKSEEGLEAALPSSNRLFGYGFVLDSEGRIRFRVAGMASADAIPGFVGVVRSLLDDPAAATRDLTMHRARYKG